MRAQAGRQLLNAAAAGCSLPLVFCFHGSSFWEKKEGSLSLPSQCGLHAILSLHFIRSLSTSHTSPPIPEKPRWPWPVCDYLIPFWSISSLSLSKYLSLPPGLPSLLQLRSSPSLSFQFFPSACLFPPEASPLRQMLPPVNAATI